MTLQAATEHESTIERLNEGYNRFSERTELSKETGYLGPDSSQNRWDSGRRLLIYEEDTRHKRKSKVHQLLRAVVGFSIQLWRTKPSSLDALQRP